MYIHYCLYVKNSNVYVYILQFVNIKLKLCNTATNQNYTTTGIFESDRGVLLTTVVLRLQLSMHTLDRT